MESIITKLYRGEVYPEEQILPRSEEALAAKKECDRREDKLEATLSKKQARLFEKMQDAEATYATLECEASFAEGYASASSLCGNCSPWRSPSGPGNSGPTSRKEGLQI